MEENKPKNNPQDAIHEQQLNNSLTDKTIVPTAETSDIINPHSEIIDMEVHHHAHDPVAPHHKKNWKSYFWEFLMLFLAVFCGFLAEYQLEHMIERERGKQYIQSFVEDLKYDTAGLTAMTKHYETKVEKLNIISSCYDSLISKQPCNSCLIDLLVNSQSFWQLNVSDRTLQQLKNAGGLRLLKKSDADSVTAYDNLIKGYKIDETTAFQETQTSIRSITNELFNYSVFRDIKASKNDTTKILFVSSDKILINKYFNELARYSIYCNRYIKKQEEIKKSAAGLISYFTNKYHF